MSNRPRLGPGAASLSTVLLFVGLGGCAVPNAPGDGLPKRKSWLPQLVTLGREGGGCASVLVCSMLELFQGALTRFDDGGFMRRSRSQLNMGF